MTQPKNRPHTVYDAFEAPISGPGTPIQIGQKRRHPAGATVTVTDINEINGHAYVNFRAPGLIGAGEGRLVQTWEVIR